jgi:hypothetical protein
LKPERIKNNMKKIFTYLAITVIFTACKKNDPPSPPLVTTTSGNLTIVAISPTSGGANTVVTIKGVNFSASLTADIVKFNGIVATVQSATDSTLTVLAPVGGTSGVVTVATSNGLATGPVFTYGPDVYVAGYQRTSNLNPVAILWKNGLPTALTGPTNDGVASAIAIADTNVYVTYYIANGTGFWQAQYWKNGIANIVTEGNYQVFYPNYLAVAIAGSDVYVAGAQTIDLYSNSDYVARYWKNGVAVTLTPGGLGAKASSIAISGNDVYVAGYGQTADDHFPEAMYWKNGVASILPSRYAQSYAQTTSIAIVGNDVYVAGSETYGVSTAKYWKNGVAIELTDGTNDAYANSIVVVGNDVYVAGQENNGTQFVAKYWKNGVAVALTGGTTDAGANSIVVVGNDVYVAGYESSRALTSYQRVGNPDESWVAKYWKNGVAVVLSNGDPAGSANSIVVK